jgi:O-antigen ligase/polysaccharide polymerase Wzy-like membrane protein
VTVLQNTTAVSGFLVHDRARALSGRAADAFGLALLAALLWRLFFLNTRTFDDLALGVAAAGVAAAWLRRSPSRTAIDLPIALYVGLTVVSALVHGGLQALTTTAGPTSAWRTIVEAAYFYGAVGLLDSRRKIAVLLVALVAGILLVSVGAAYDNLMLITHGERMRAYQTVRQWSGYPEIGLLQTLALPLILAVIVASRRPIALVSSIVLLVYLGITTWEVDSRGSYVIMPLTFLVLTVTEVVKLRRLRLLAFASVATLAVVGYAAMHPQWAAGALEGWSERFVDTEVVRVHRGEGAETGFGRFQIWGHTLPMVRDHLLLGVGPGRYMGALRSGGYVPRPTPDDTHAHSMLLHIAAENGVPAAIAFLAIWWQLLPRLARRVDGTRVGMLALAFGGVLVAYFLRNLGDDFTSGIIMTSDRISFLLWTLFAAGAAVARLPRDSAMPA